MLKNYLLIAWRELLKNKLYAGINLLGLTVGLTVYVFGFLLVAYEESHDQFFENSDRIYTAASHFSPDAGIGLTLLDGVYTGVAPLIETDLPQIEATARSVRREFLVSLDDRQFYERIQFVDPELLDVFNFDYIDGDKNALTNPNGMVMVRSMAEKYFGSVNDAVGKTLLLDHETPLSVMAVIEDLPENSHFVYSVVGASDGFGIFAPLSALDQAVGYDLEGNWNNLSLGDLTYMLWPEGTKQEEVQTGLDSIWETHFDEDMKEFVTGLQARRLDQVNTFMWDAIGLPVMSSIQILALLVLIIAIVNYTNLATAQSMGRSREVGLRKTMGAARSQLLVQFLVESISLVALSMLFAVVVLEVVVPVFNDATGKGLELEYSSLLPWLLFSTLMVGVVSGVYPAFLITRSAPIEALKNSGNKGSKGSLFRGVMLGIQFTISIFMLAMVIVVYFQNLKVSESANIYPRDQVVVLQRLDIESIQQRMTTLRSEWLQIPGVEAVTYSSQVPYEQSNSSVGLGTVMGDDETQRGIMQIMIDEHFLDAYNIPLLAGRRLRTDMSADTLKEGVYEANILLNELAVERFGLSAAPEEAIGTVLYDYPETRQARAYTIVGVLPNQNFQGFHNEIKPMVFMQFPANYSLASVRVAAGVPLARVLTDVEGVWTTLVPDYPMQSEFLVETFDGVFKIFNLTTQVLGGFAMMALMLSMIGLFGLAAFMAQNRTREIGIRKVMGANILQIIRLLIWQFSKPVMWSLLFALPAAYFASMAYLDFFANRIAAPAGIVLASGVTAVLFAWIIVSVHAVRIARANPIQALRCE